MRLTILTQYYPPEVGAPQARLSELAHRCVARGHAVTVVTAMPNYPEGRVHAGHGGVLRREQRDGVAVLRTFIYPTQKAALVPRLASYGSFAASSAILGPVFLRKADYLLVESPPLLLGPTAWWLSTWSRARLIFNVSDLWPESAVHVGVLRRESRAFRFATRLERACYRRAWLVTGQSRTIVSDIRSRFPGVNTFHFSNGVDSSRFCPEARTKEARQALGGPDGFVVLYAGLHGLAQGLGQLLEAATLLQHDRRVRFVLVGDGPEKSSLMAEAAKRRLPNVEFLPPQPFARIPSLLASADAIVVPLKSEIPGAVPSKLYEAMASGQPVIMVGTGEAADLVRAYEAGIAVLPGNIDGLVSAVQRLCTQDRYTDQAGANGRRAAVEYFDRDTICGRFIDHLETELASTAGDIAPG